MKLFPYCLIFLLSMPAAAMAVQSLPFLYSRSDIAIHRAHPPALQPMPWQEKTAVEMEPSALTFDVEIRDAATLYNQQGWFNLDGMQERSGLLLAFAAATAAPLPASSQYAPLDILLIDAEGKIAQIVPSIVLARMEQPIVPAAPILAFMFLKGGNCEKYAIKPGDRVEYTLFKQQPTVLTGTQEKKN